MAKAKPSADRINTVTDMLTSENPEHTDVVVVKAAVERVLNETALIQNAEAVKRALVILTAVPHDTGTPEDREAAQAGVAEAKAVEPESVEEPVKPTDPINLTDEQHAAMQKLSDDGMLAAIEAARERLAPIFTPPSPVPVADGLTFEPIPKNIALQMTLADMVTAGFDGMLINGDQAFTITLGDSERGMSAAEALRALPGIQRNVATGAKFSYSVINKSALPVQYKLSTGEPDHAALEKAMNVDKAPNISGCLISKRKA
jgi:hypothetical protein